VNLLQECRSFRPALWKLPDPLALSAGSETLFPS